MAAAPYVCRLVKEAFTRIITDADQFGPFEITITDANLNFDRAFATIRVIGPGFQRGTMIKLSPTPEWDLKHGRGPLSVEWADLNRREFLSEAEICSKNPGDLVLRVAHGLGSKEYRRQFV